MSNLWGQKCNIWGKLGQSGKVTDIDLNIFVKITLFGCIVNGADCWKLWKKKNLCDHQWKRERFERAAYQTCILLHWEQNYSFCDGYNLSIAYSRLLHGIINNLKWCLLICGCIFGWKMTQKRPNVPCLVDSQSRSVFVNVICILNSNLSSWCWFISCFISK